MGFSLKILLQRYSIAMLEERQKIEGDLLKQYYEMLKKAYKESKAKTFFYLLKQDMSLLPQ